MRHDKPPGWHGRLLVAGSPEERHGASLVEKWPGLPLPANVLFDGQIMPAQARGVKHMPTPRDFLPQCAIMTWRTAV